MPAPSASPAIEQGAFRAFFVYDVADTIDLRRLRTVGGEGVARAPLQLRPEASSEFIQYPISPLIVRLPDLPDYGAQARAKIFDFGVVSIRISIPFAGPWNDYAALARRLRRDPRLEARARAALEDVLTEIGPALDEPHDAQMEDYFVLEVDRFKEPLKAAALVGRLRRAARPVAPLRGPRAGGGRGRRVAAGGAFLLPRRPRHRPVGRGLRLRPGRGRRSDHGHPGVRELATGRIPHLRRAARRKSSTRSTRSHPAGRSGISGAGAKRPNGPTACATCSSTSSN